jgi:DinB superfamily
VTGVAVSRSLPLEVALARHRDAVAAFLASAAATEPDAWTRPASEGKWSPAQIAEHLRLAVEAVKRELDRGPGMKLRLSAWKRFLLRRTVLPKLLKTGHFPRGVRAPREIQPTLPPDSREEALRRLEAAASELETRCRAHPHAATLRLLHPYFGALPASDLIRILAWHTLHHRSQLPGAEKRSSR